MAIHGSSRWPSKWLGSAGGGLSRRSLLLGCATAAASHAQQQPETVAFDLSLLDGPSVHNELFFVREHFPQPSGLSAAGWKLPVTGAVSTPLSLSFDDLTALPRRTIPATLECAENPVGGGMVSHAEWTGCPLRAVLERAAPASGVTLVKLTGADGFSYTLPLEKALHPDTLLVTTMAGEKLPPQHGFPVRALIPGWYGMASIKWLQSIALLVAGEAGSPEYRRRKRSLLAGTMDDGAIAAGQVKAVFARPLDGAILTRRGVKFIVRGAAWAGENRVRTVEVSADGAATWRAAKLDDAPAPYAWVRWSWEWTVPAAPGPVDLAVRAADDAGRTQPAEPDPARADAFESNAWQTVRVVVS